MKWLRERGVQLSTIDRTNGYIVLHQVENHRNNVEMIEILLIEDEGLAMYLTIES